MEVAVDSIEEVRVWRDGVLDGRIGEPCMDGAVGGGCCCCCC